MRCVVRQKRCRLCGPVLLELLGELARNADFAVRQDACRRFKSLENAMGGFKKNGRLRSFRCAG